MRQKGGAFAVLAALSAVAFHAGTGSPGSGPEQLPHAPTGYRLETSETAFLHTLSAYYHVPEVPSLTTESGPCGLPRLPVSGEFNWIIATVPDPENSNLKLDFDRDVEAIQIAAASAGYLFDRHWFPWQLHGDSASHEAYVLEGLSKPGPAGIPGSELSIEPRKDSKRGDLPGVILFRRRRDQSPSETANLAVFLVAETPTAGIQSGQFRTAVCYGNLGTVSQPPYEPSSDLKIAGPSFSGSFDSLQSSIKSLDPVPQRISIRSWTEDLGSQKRFLESNAKDHPLLDFRATKAPSVLAINRFVDYIRTAWHDQGPIILLVEEGTGFGEGLTRSLVNPTAGVAFQHNACTDPVCRQLEDLQLNHDQDLQLLDRRVFVLKFPRNISRLRNATESDTHVPGFAGDAKRADIPHSGLTLSLREEAEVSSEIPQFSKQQSPVSDESILFGLASLLKKQTIHYVGLIATDPLDELFLSRYLRTTCPNMRLFTLDTDLLYEHGSDSSDYEGMFAVTYYPLFAMSQLWSGSKGNRVLHLFPSSTAEAVYNGVVDLLGEFRNGEEGAPARDFRDIGQPLAAPGAAGDPFRPELWISVAGRNGYLPVAVLPNSTTQLTVVAEKASQRSLLVPEYWPSWGYAFLVILSVCFLYAWLLMIATPLSKQLVAFFAVKPREPGAWPRAFYLFATGASLSALVTFWLVVPMEIVSRNLPEPFVLRRTVLVLFLASAALTPLLRILVQKNLIAHSKGRIGLREAVLQNPSSATHIAAGVIPPLLLVSGIVQALRNPFQVTGHSHGALSMLWLLCCLGSGMLGVIVAASFIPVCQTGSALLKSSPSSIRISAAELMRNRYLRAIICIAFVLLGTLVYTANFAMAGTCPEQFLAACRALDLTSGASPLVPLTILMMSITSLGLTHLRRVTYYEDRCPRVPQFKHDRFCPRLDASVAEVNRRTRTISSHPVYIASLVAAAAAAVLLVLTHEHQTIEHSRLENLMVGLAFTAGVLLIVVWIRLMLIWSAFHEFLQQLERHPLRRVFSLLPRGFVWSPVWQGGGKKRTHVAVTRSLECVYALLNHPQTPSRLKAVLQENVNSLQRRVDYLLSRSARRCRVTSKFHRALEQDLANVASAAVGQLRQNNWPRGSYELRSELVQKDENKEAVRVSRSSFTRNEPDAICGELVAFRFLAFINHVLYQMQNLVGYISLGFLLLVVALNSYEFRARTVIDWMLAILFLVLSFGIVTMFAQADRDAILSRITGTEEGKLGFSFVTHLVTFGAMPLLVLMATHFPMVGRFFFSWVKPALEAIH